MKEMTSKSVFMPQVITKKGKSPLKNFSLQNPAFLSIPTLVLTPLDDGSGFSPKKIDLFETVTIGRSVNSKTSPQSDNGYFESKVLSRQHAELKGEKGSVYIRDCGSSNGTFVNGQRLSKEGEASDWTQVHSGDVIDFGIDIMEEDGVTITYRKVSASVTVTVPNSSGETDVVAETKENAPKADTARVIAELEASLAKVEEATGEFPQAGRKLQAQLDEALAQNELLKRRVKQLEEQNPNAASGELSLLEQKLKSVQAAHEKANEHCKLLDVQVSTLKAKEATLATQIAEKTARIEKLESQALDDRLKKQVESLTKALSDAEAKGQAFEAQISRITKDAASRIETAVSETTARLTTAHQSKIEQLNEALQDAKEKHSLKYSKLQQQYNELQEVISNRRLTIVSSVVCGVCIGLGIAFGVYSFN